MRVILLFILLSSWIHACVNNTQTVDEEQWMRNLMTRNEGIFTLISGQYPHHGQGYHQARIEAFEAGLADQNKWRELKNDPVMEYFTDDESYYEMKNDLAVAYLKRKRYEDAIAKFVEIEKEYPGEYKTYANLGVLYKKIGEYDKAALYIRKSLEIKPEGHLGLGDYYLKMIEHLGKTHGNPEYDSNFLEHPYSELLSYEEERFKNVKALIRADRSFADAYVAIGDMLRDSSNENVHPEKLHYLSVLAYLKAERLGFSHKQELNRRIAEAIEEARTNIYQKAMRRLQTAENIREFVEVELDKAEDWVAAFEKTEGEIAKENIYVTFEEVENKMEEKGIHRYFPEVKNAVTRDARYPNKVHFFVILALMITLPLLALNLFRRVVRFFKPA